MRRGVGCGVRVNQGCRETKSALKVKTAGVGLVGERLRASETCLLRIDVFIKASVQMPEQAKGGGSLSAVFSVACTLLSAQFCRALQTGFHS